MQGTIHASQMNIATVLLQKVFEDTINKIFITLIDLKALMSLPGQFCALPGNKNNGENGNPNIEVLRDGPSSPDLGKCHCK